MRRNLNNRAFFLQWELLYAATNPGYRKDQWDVGGVEWNKDRHSYWGEHYSVSLDVHRLICRQKGGGAWQLLVVAETWWGPDRDRSIRNTRWCKVLAGTSQQISEWVRQQAAAMSSAGSSDLHDIKEGRCAMRT